METAQQELRPPKNWGPAHCMWEGEAPAEPKDRIMETAQQELRPPKNREPAHWTWEGEAPAVPRCFRRTRVFNGGRRSSLRVLSFCLVLIGAGLAGPARGAEDRAKVIAALPAPLLLHPQNGALIAPIQAWSGVLFSWAPVPGAVSYRLEWVVDGSAKEATVTGTTQLKSFQSGTRVDWRVTAVDEAGMSGAMSETRTFFIGSSGGLTPTPGATPTPLAFFLAPPQLVAPADGARFSAEELRQGVVLQWSAVAGSFGYRVNFTVDGIPQPPQNTSRTTFALSLAVDHAVLIQWAVQGLGGSGQAGASSATRTFHVAAPGQGPTPQPDSHALSPPDLLSPSDRAWIRVDEAFSGVEFRWSEVTGAASYVLQVRRDEAPEMVKETGETSASVLFAIIEETDLLWAIATVNPAGVTGPYASPRVLRIRFGKPGDLDLTDTVDAKDLYLFSSTWALGESHPLLRRADLDGDGFVTRTDLLLFCEMSVKSGQ